MKTIHIPWAFYLTYNHRKGELLLQPSTICQQTHGLDPLVTLDLEEMKSWIHKYDYRKFAYFSEESLKHPFDTMIRLKCGKEQDYFRTQAICQSTGEGFQCVLIEDKLLHQLATSLHQMDHADSKLSWLDQHLYELDTIKHLSPIKKHLNHMIERNTI